MTTAIVLGLLITVAIVTAGWFGGRYLFVTRPEMHRLEVEYSKAVDEEKAAKARMENASKLPPQRALNLDDGPDAVHRWYDEDRRRQKPVDDYEDAQVVTFCIQRPFWYKYGRRPNYLPPSER